MGESGSHAAEAPTTPQKRGPPASLARLPTLTKANPKATPMKRPGASFKRPAAKQERSKEVEEVQEEQIEEEMPSSFKRPSTSKEPRSHQFHTKAAGKSKRLRQRVDESMTDFWMKMESNFLVVRKPLKMASRQMTNEKQS